MRCARCGREVLESCLCIRCGREVCSECFSNGLCLDCRDFLDALNRDLELRLEYFERSALEVARTVSKRPDCVQCSCLREWIVSLIKGVRELEAELWRRRMNEQLERAERCEKALSKAAAAIIAAQKVVKKS